MKKYINNTGDAGELKGYVAGHMLVGVVLAVVVIVALKIALGFFDSSGPMSGDLSGSKEHDRGMETTVSHGNSHPTGDDPAVTASHELKTTQDTHGVSSRNLQADVQDTPTHATDTDQTHATKDPVKDHTPFVTQQPAASHQTTAAVHAAPKTHETQAAPQPAAAVHTANQKTAPAHSAGPNATAGQAVDTHGADTPATPSYTVKGMAFVDAVIKPLEYELNQRFYGWRPNDILNFTDNVNNFQLGVLEVTRRTAVILAQRISRTGSTAAFDSDLENAMNWFMIKADRYWFPSAESKYRASLDEMRNYFHKLERGEAQFYTRTDNLIPLLTAYQDLLGSSDENLVKAYEDDGSPVSYFKSDDYFFYARGVVSAMATILEAIEKDFHIMVSREGGMEVLHHAIESCHHAMEIDPWVILNSDLSSVFANHRLNMAAPISHARFYLGVLIRALST
jgi:hypothetical protein